MNPSLFGACCRGKERGASDVRALLARKEERAGLNKAIGEKEGNEKHSLIKIMSTPSKKGRGPLFKCPPSLHPRRDPACN